MIGFFNFEKQITDYFSDAIIIRIEGDSFPEIEGLVIDWIYSPNKKQPTISFARQASIVERYVKKGLPTFIFDRFSSITFKEFKYLKKFNTKLFEPYLISRDGFGYLPFWIHNIYDLNIYDREDREFDITFKGYLTDKIKSFEEYYVDIKQHYPKYKIAFEADIKNSKVNEYKDMDINYIESLDITRSKMSIVIGSKNDYKNGKLDYLYAESINNGCIPLVANDNRFYNGFPTCIDSIKNNPIPMFKLFLESTKDLKYGILMGTYEYIEKFHPEMKVNYVVDIIKNAIGK